MLWGSLYVPVGPRCLPSGPSSSGPTELQSSSEGGSGVSTLGWFPVIAMDFSARGLVPCPRGRVPVPKSA